MRHIIEEQTTLLEALGKVAPDSSRNTLRTWVKDGRVVVDGIVQTQVNAPLTKGQQLVVEGRKPKKEGSLPILYEDSHFVVIDKPSGLLSVATNFDSQNTAHALLKRRYAPKKVYVVHRLDQDTSGVMMFALSELAYETLKAALAKHDVKRIYYGVVEGELQGKGTWDSYLYEDANYYVHATDDPTKGERAITHYEAVEYRNGKTKVRFQLETGKKNQIRVHCQMAGHPIVGDTKYGSPIQHARRLHLHAAELSFIHPATNKEMHFSSEYI
jgi:tRNA pseudouridine32 synthase/23S rRNA pseudouridine746 synthase/23S rRNA pseudouridine1911/1915/1917 synthase